MRFNKVRLSQILIFTGLLSLGVTAQAEMYVAGQVGVTLPNSLSRVDGTGSLTGVSFSNLDLHDSVMYGAKLGYYFDQMKWFGLETEVFNTTPNIKQQGVTASFQGGSLTATSPGLSHRMLTWAPIILKARITEMGSFQPYVGFGLGVNFSRLNDGQGASASDNARPGFVSQVGASYLITNNLSMFGEWKVNYVRSTYNDIQGSGAGLQATYIAHHVVFGLGYHF